MGTLMENLYPGMDIMPSLCIVPRRYIYSCKLCFKQASESNEPVFVIFTYPARKSPHQLDKQDHEKIARHLKEAHNVNDYKEDDFKLYFGIGKE